MELSLDEGKFLDSKSLSAPLSRRRRCCARLRRTGHHSVMETGQSRPSPVAVAAEASRERLPPSHSLPGEDFCSVFQGTRGPRRKQRQRSRRTCLVPSSSLCHPENQPLGSQAVCSSRWPRPLRTQSQVAGAERGRDTWAAWHFPGREPQGSAQAPVTGSEDTGAEQHGSLRASVARPPLENSRRRSVTPRDSTSCSGQVPASQSTSALSCAYLVPLGASASPRKAGPLDAWPAEGQGSGRGGEPILVSPLGHPVLVGPFP